jgi:PEGA domain
MGMTLFKKLIGSVLAVVFLANVTGCAAMFHGTSQQVAIRSNHSDAELYVNDAYLGKGNTVTSFKKSQNYTITVRKEGCEPFTLPVSKSFDAVTLLGILLDFGVISILVVDGAATGAWSQFDQTSYVLDPRCVAVIPSPATPATYRSPGTGL